MVSGSNHLVRVILRDKLTRRRAATLWDTAAIKGYRFELQLDTFAWDDFARNDPGGAQRRRCPISQAIGEVLCLPISK
jgi:hypothetical protein